MIETVSGLSTNQKKAAVYGGIAASIAGLVWMFSGTAEPKPVKEEPVVESLTGGADVRTVTIDGLNDRLRKIEDNGIEADQATDLKFQQLQNQLSLITQQLATAEKRNAELAARISDYRAEARSTPVPTNDPQIQVFTPTEPSREEFAERAAERDQERRDAIYTRSSNAPDFSTGFNNAPVPRIATYQAEKPAEDENVNRIMVNVPAGSILQAMLLTGVDAPTGTQASGSPIPVLMRIKAEAIMPNYARADIKDCHLLGAAYGELASERVVIRGETVSCILKDNSAVEGKIKFFVTGEDGKNGVRGRLVTRAGRLIAGAAASALTQGIVGALDGANQTTVTADDVVAGLAGARSGAIEGAQAGFDKITDYYIQLAEETFPVIEINNGRWVDVILTSGLEIAWKG